MMHLKCGLDPLQIADRLQYHPDLIELQLYEEDLSAPQKLIHTIRTLKNQGISVYLHHPMKVKGQFLDILSKDPQVRRYYGWSCEFLAEICQKENILCVVHPHYSSSECSNLQDVLLRKKVKDRIEYFQRNLGDFFLWENTVEGIFSWQNPFLFEEIIKPLGLKLCFDISHAFISVKGSNRRLYKILTQIQDFARYFHVVDSMGVCHDSLPLGKGRINWRRVVPFLDGKDFVLEIGLDDYCDATPMVNSAHYLEQIKQGSKSLG